MILNTTDTLYQLFLAELDEMLKDAGIAHSHLPITAEVDQREDRLAPLTEKGTQEVGRVILYIEEHLSEELSLEQLADKVELSKYQLIRRFRDEQGITPWKYLIQKRIQKAKRLLESGMSPGQVAAETGFYDQSHLNRVFREETGSTPKEYQEKNFANKN